ncbi:MAG: Rrf2 family transcriptional regulator [Kofleriaceae bacterium]
MKRDSRLSRTLHALLHMADAGRALTSEELAGMLMTNPVVVRRTMAGLRDASIVRSTKGHGGGWELAQPLAKIRLADIYIALDEPTVFAMASEAEAESPGCLVEKAVTATMSRAFAEAETLLMRRFHEITLADIAASVHATGHRMGSSPEQMRKSSGATKSAKSTRGRRAAHVSRGAS